MSVVEELVQDLAGAEERQRIDAYPRYRELLVALAADKPPKNPAKVRELLDVCGKSPDELAADVGRMRERLAMAAVVDEGCEGAEVDLAKSRQDLENAQAELSRAREAFEAQHAAAKELEANARGRIQKVEHARRQLAGTVLDLGLSARVREFESRRDPLLADRHDLRQKLHRAKLRAEEAAESASPLPKLPKNEQYVNKPSKSQRERWRKRAEETAQAVVDLQSQLDEVEAMLAELEPERLEIEAAKLTP